MEVPLLHNDALQWTVIAVPPAAPVPVHPPPPCCPAPRNVAGGATPASSSSAPASTIVWFVPCQMLPSIFITCIAEMVTISTTFDQSELIAFCNNGNCLIAASKYAVYLSMSTFWKFPNSNPAQLFGGLYGNYSDCLLYKISAALHSECRMALCRAAEILTRTDILHTSSIHIISILVWFVFCPMRLFMLHC